MKIMKRLGSVLIAALLCATVFMPAIEASAAPYPYPDPSFPEDGYYVEGSVVSFKKYLILDAGDTVPDAEFYFWIYPGTPVPAESSGYGVEVMAGPEVTWWTSRRQSRLYPWIEDVVFSSGDPTSTNTAGMTDLLRTNAQRGGAANTDAVQFDSGEKYAVQDMLVDLEHVHFDQPGIYRYVIEEEIYTPISGVVFDTENDRILDVFVTDDGTGTLVVSAYNLYSRSGKTDGFTNEYVTKDLKIEKEVSGNMASRDKYFAITVKVAGALNTASYVVSLGDDGDANTNDGNADATTAANDATIEGNAGKSNPTSVTGAQLKNGVTFYLNHGQSVVIRGLPYNVRYTVTENAESYTSAVKSGDTNSGVLGTVAGNGKMAVAGFTNTLRGSVPTGVMLTAAPGAALMAIAVLGLAAIKRKKNEA